MVNGTFVGQSELLHQKFAKEEASAEMTEACSAITAFIEEEKIQTSCASYIVDKIFFILLNFNPKKFQ
jgi:hypothetical protein